jgi:hypothetical protein
MSYNKMNGSVNFWAKEMITKNTVKHFYKIIFQFFMLQDFMIFCVTKFYNFLCYKIFQFSMLQNDFMIFYVTKWFSNFLCYKILWFFVLQDFMIFYVTKWFYDFLCYNIIRIVVRLFQKILDLTTSFFQLK